MPSHQENRVGVFVQPLQKVERHVRPSPDQRCFGVQLIPQDIVLGEAMGIHDHDLCGAAGQRPLDGRVRVIGNRLSCPHFLHIGNARNAFDVYRDKDLHVFTPLS